MLFREIQNLFNFYSISTRKVLNEYFIEYLLIVKFKMTAKLVQLTLYLLCTTVLYYVNRCTVYITPTVIYNEIVFISYNMV